MTEEQIKKLKAYIDAKTEFEIAEHENNRHDDYEFGTSAEEKQVNASWLDFEESIKTG